MKITVLATVLLLCSMVQSSIAGQDKQKIEEENWDIIASDSSNRCKNIGVDFSGTHDFNLLVTTDTVRVIHDRTTGITYSGKINPNKPQTIYYTASYREDAGMISERITFKRLDESHESGTSTWYWGDGLMSCEGGYSFTATL